jgi:DNA-binding NtrC family response regulator
LLERALVEEALRDAGGNVSQAARALGMERSRLAKLRDRLGLDPDPQKPR